MFDVFKTVKFGRYKQKIDKLGRDVILPIEWYILDIKDNLSLLLSKYCFPCEFSDFRKQSSRWETSTIRYFLNNKDNIKKSFLLNAFTEEEEKNIIMVELNNPGNPYFDAVCDKNTFDKIFLLSIDEFNKYVKNSRISIAAPVENLLDGYEYVFEDHKTVCGDNATFWPLRTPGHTKKVFSIVNPRGVLFPYGGFRSSHSTVAARIAMWAKLD